MPIENIFETLKKFTEEDWIDIINWTKSPIYQLNKIVAEADTDKKILERDRLKIFNLIYEEKNNLNSLDIEQFMLFLEKAIYKGNDQTSNINFRNRFGELKNNYINKYVGLKMMVTKPSKARWQQQTLRFFSEQNLPNHFKELSNKIESKNLQKVNGALDFYQAYIHSQRLAAYYALSNSKLSNTYLALSNKHLLIYSKFKTLAINAEIQNRLLIYNIDLKIGEELIIEEDLKKEHKLIFLQEKVFQIQKIILANKTKLSQLDEKTTFFISDAIDECIEQIIKIDINKLSNHIDIKTIYFQLLNICRVLIQDGLSFMSYFLKLINNLEQQELILQHNKINPNLFKIVIDLCIENNEITYAIKFYNKFKLEIPKGIYKLNEEKRKEVFSKLNYFQKVCVYSNAHILFSQKKYSEAILVLENLKYTKQEIFDLDLARLFIKLYLELEMTDEKTNMLRSAKGKIKNIKIDLPFYAKEKLETLVSILSTSKIIDKSFIKSKANKKVLSASDRKYLLSKFK